MARDYLICYDIGDPGRLARVHRALAQQAMAVQFSVFLFTGSANALALCLQKLEGLIDPRTDDVRAYPLPARGCRLLIGQRPLPEGVFWAGLAQPWRGGDCPSSARPSSAPMDLQSGGAMATAMQPAQEDAQGLARPWAMPLMPAMHPGRDEPSSPEQ